MGKKGKRGARKGSSKRNGEGRKKDGWGKGRGKGKGKEGIVLLPPRSIDPAYGPDCRNHEVRPLFSRVPSSIAKNIQLMSIFIFLFFRS